MNKSVSKLRLLKHWRYITKLHVNEKGMVVNSTGKVYFQQMGESRVYRKDGDIEVIVTKEFDNFGFYIKNINGKSYQEFIDILLNVKDDSSKTYALLKQSDMGNLLKEYVTRDLTFNKALDFNQIKPSLVTDNFKVYKGEDDIIHKMSLAIDHLLYQYNNNKLR